MIEARKAASLRQRDLAARIGVHERAVGGWERGLYPPAVEHWEKLIGLIGLTQEQLVARQLFFARARNSDL